MIVPGHSEVLDASHTSLLSFITFFLIFSFNGKKLKKSQHFQVIFSGRSALFDGRSAVVPGHSEGLEACHNSLLSLTTFF